MPTVPWYTCNLAINRNRNNKLHSPVGCSKHFHIEDGAFILLLPHRAKTTLTIVLCGGGSFSLLRHITGNTALFTFNSFNCYLSCKF